VGIGLNADTRSADDGKLFTVQAVAFKPGVGFVASVRGATLPAQATLRLGGDGRAASSQAVSHQAAQADLKAIASQGRCRIVLSTPGVFAQGWLPNGFLLEADGHHWLNLHGVRARLVCATVPRSETISGWDLAANNGKGQPKAAQRAAPTGSVYWLDQLQATPETLGKLTDHGLWSDACEDTQRRAEGFNRFDFAAFDCR
jgi:CRISPR-associated protein Cmr3